MSIKITSNFNSDSFMKDVRKQMRDALEATMVEEVVKQARAEGLTSSENINLKLDADARSLGVDEARVLRAVDKKLHFSR